MSENTVYPTDNRTYKKLLQDDYQKNERKRIRTIHNKSYQDFRF